MTTKQATVWLNTFQKQRSDAYWLDLSFPAQYNHLKFEEVKANKNATAEEDEWYFKELDKRIAINHKYKDNQPLPDGVIPESMYSTTVKKETVTPPPLFAISNGYIMMSKAFYLVLKQFRLGGNQIFPVNFYNLPRKELMNEETYYLLNVCHPQQYFLPKESNQERLEPHKYTDPAKGHEVYYRPYNEEESLCYVFSSEAIQSPVDIWYDPFITNAVFMSDKLVSALQSAGVGDDLSLLPCHLSA